MTTYTKIDWPPGIEYDERIRWIAVLTRQHYNAPQTIELLPMEG